MQENKFCHYFCKRTMSKASMAKTTPSTWPRMRTPTARLFSRTWTKVPRRMNPHAIDNDSDDDMGDTEADAMGTHDVHHQMALSDWLDRIQSTALKSSYLT